MSRVIRFAAGHKGYIAKDKIYDLCKEYDVPVYDMVLEKIEAASGSIELEKGIIVAKRHIHMTPLEASRARVKDNDEVFVITESYERGLIFADVVVRVSPTFKLAMHVDTDEANAFASDEAPTGAILKLFDGQTYSLQQWADEIQSGINR